MNMKKKILKLLYRSFEEKLEEKEQKQLEEALKKSEELRQEKEQVSAMRKDVSDSGHKTFKPFFAERVMNRIIAEERKSPAVSTFEPLKAVFQRLAIAAAIVIIALVVYNLGIGESLTMDEAFYMSELTFEEILPVPLF
jgi:predicted ATP-dependent endonuclease of OLD family